MRGREKRHLVGFSLVGFSLVGLALVAALFVSRQVAESRSLAASSRWASVADALDAGLGVRGWLPEQIPPDASQIAEWHDLDTNDLCGVFSLPLPVPERTSAGGATKGNSPAHLGSACRQLADPRLETLRGATSNLTSCNSRSGTIVVIDTGSGVGGYWNVERCE